MPAARHRGGAGAEQPSCGLLVERAPSIDRWMQMCKQYLSICIYTKHQTSLCANCFMVVFVQGMHFPAFESKSRSISQHTLGLSLLLLPTKRQHGKLLEKEKRRSHRTPRLEPQKFFPVHGTEAAASSGLPKSRFRRRGPPSPLTRFAFCEAVRKVNNF